MKDQNFDKKLEKVAVNGLGEVSDFFCGDKSATTDRADRAIKLIGHHVKNRAIRAKEAEVALSAGELMGVRGEALAPIFEQLTGRDPTHYLPIDGEQSSVDADDNTKKQALRATK